MSQRIAFAAFLLGLLLILPGCGDAPPEFAEVQGIVFVNGRPRSGLLVRFLPDPEKGNDLPINAIGKTNSEGRYQLKYSYKGEEGVGAPVGWHRR